MRKVFTYIPAIVLFLFGVWLGRALFPRRDIETQIVTKKEIVVDTVYRYSKIFYSRPKPLEVTISNKLYPPEVIFHSHNVEGLLYVKRSRRYVEAQGFRSVGDSLSFFSQKWRLDLGREWAIFRSSSAERSYYTLRAKRVNLTGGFGGVLEQNGPGLFGYVAVNRRLGGWVYADRLGLRYGLFVVFYRF